MTLVSTGHLRRIAQPLLFRYWFRRGTNREVTTRVGSFELRVSPTVFHPKYFGSSLILGRYVESLDLEGKRFLDDVTVEDFKEQLPVRAEFARNAPEMIDAICGLCE